MLMKKTNHQYYNSKFQANPSLTVKPCVKYIYKTSPQTKPNQTKPNQTKPNQTKPCKTKPSLTKRNQTKPNESKPNQIKIKQQKRMHAV